MINFDLKSASVHGKIRRSRARVLWRHGVLKVISQNGASYQVKASKPTRLDGFLCSWMVDTDAGPVILKRKCMTCGGPAWWRIIRMSADEAWELAANG